MLPISVLVDLYAYYLSEFRLIYLLLLDDHDLVWSAMIHGYKQNDV